jgi:antitoxin (DNA-binding transcriptional repressor) of toxin-antitoxin stability system
LIDPTPATAKIRQAKNGASTYSDFLTADNALTQAAPADVRSGTVYADGNLTGTCAVPAAGSVALGVPVDATTGTAVLTPEAVWGHASRTITEGGITAADVWNAATRTITGGTVTTLTSAPTVPTAAAIASQVRTELATELARVDAGISTRATPANIPAADITAIKAKTDALNTERLANVATTAIVGNLIAQANS